MRTISAATQAALNDRAVLARDFVWFTVKDRITGDPVEIGYWSDVGLRDAQLINPKTQQIETRQFIGAGTLIKMPAIPLVSNGTLQSIKIELSQVGDANRLVRTYDAKFARVEIYRGLFKKGSMVQVDPAYSRFTGYVDDIDIPRPKEGAAGSIKLKCVTSEREMTKSNPATRSDADQRLRDPTDSFRRHAAVVGEWEINWGTKK